VDNWSKKGNKSRQMWKPPLHAPSFRGLAIASLILELYGNDFPVLFCGMCVVNLLDQKRNAVKKNTEDLLVARC